MKLTKVFLLNGFCLNGANVAHADITPIDNDDVSIMILERYPVGHIHVKIVNEDATHYAAYIVGDDVVEVKDEFYGMMIDKHTA